VEHVPIELPEREHREDYARGRVPQEIIVPEIY
jgi:hypothetical protein